MVRSFKRLNGKVGLEGWQPGRVAETASAVNHESELAKLKPKEPPRVAGFDCEGRLGEFP